MQAYLIDVIGLNDAIEESIEVVEQDNNLDSCYFRGDLLETEQIREEDGRTVEQFRNHWLPFRQLLRHRPVETHPIETISLFGTLILITEAASGTKAAPYVASR